MDRFRLALTTNSAETSVAADDPRLRGRTYAIPFEDVWRATLALVGGGLRGWHLVSADDETGRIVAEATTMVFRLVDDVNIHIRLDDDAQTRVDLRSVSRTGRADLGTNTRRIGNFCARLDGVLSERPTRRPQFRADDGPAEPAST
jgi:hypothetical protein